MSVATKNPFAILDDETSSRPASPPPAPAPVAAKPTSTPSTRGNQRGKSGPASRGGRYYPRGGGSKSADPNREPPVSPEEPPAQAEGTKRRFDGERKDGERKDGERRDGERRDGRARGRGAPRGRGRTFDRHSATGKTDSEKKVHQSWGGDDGNTERQVEEAATKDVAAESAGMNDWATPAESAGMNDWATPADGDGAAGGDDGWGTTAPEESIPAPVNGEAEGDKADGRRRDREEEEDNTLTLDQYLAQQKEKDTANVPKIEARKANEGADDTIWKDATPLGKNEEESYFHGKTKAPPKTRTEKKEKVFLEITAQFERPSRGRGRGGGDRGDRGDRGRGRGSGGRGRGRGPSNGPAPNVSVDDESAFPALS